MIGIPGHGKGECDSLGGVDKSFVRSHMETSATPEANDDASNNRLAPHREVDGHIQSFADSVVGISSQTDREFGVES